MTSKYCRTVLFVRVASGRDSQHKRGALKDMTHNDIFNDIINDATSTVEFSVEG